MSKFIYLSFLIHHLIIISTLVFSPIAFSQTAQADRSIYRSEIDQLFTVKKIAILPSSDNLNGIYSRPLEAHMTEFLEKNHHWDIVPANFVGPILTPNEVEESAQIASDVSRNLDADAFLVSRVTKGPNGVSIKISMFLTKDSKLFSSSEITDYKRFELGDLKQKIEEVASQVLSRLPYQGVILSRNDTMVTVNLGKSDGISSGQIVSVVQIIKATRHPKFGFLIDTEKEILGKIRLIKIDDTLSFGKIVTEKEKGAIQIDSKISGIDFVSYPGSDVLGSNSSARDEISKRPDSEITFGRNARNWVPKKPPTFGQVGVRFGLGSLTYNRDTGSDSLEGTAIVYPSVFIDGEMWITPQWTTKFQMRQGIIGMKNPGSDGPSELSQNLSSYEFLASYNVRLGETVWGPRIELLGGFATYDLKTDSSSDGLTSTNYSGVKFGILGSYPVTADQSWSAGAALFFFYEPKMSESPSGGNNENAINQFNFFATKKLGQNLKAVLALDFELYSSDFSGSVNSSSQRHIVSSGGLAYMF